MKKRHKNYIFIFYLCIFHIIFPNSKNSKAKVKERERFRKSVSETGVKEKSLCIHNYLNCKPTSL